MDDMKDKYGGSLLFLGVAVAAGLFAIFRIDKHEAVCTERWNESRDDSAAIRRGIEGLYTRIWQAATAIIALLIALSAYLIAHSLFGHV